MSADLMPVRLADAEPRSAALDDLRGALVADLATQQEAVADLRATASALAGQPDTDSLLERELAERAEARALEAIDDIRAALARMDDGSYGVCERCSAAIPVERLQAIPSTRHCVGCPPANAGGTTLLG